MAIFFDATLSLPYILASRFLKPVASSMSMTPVKLYGLYHCSGHCLAYGNSFLILLVFILIPSNASSPKYKASLDANLP
jgi:hypothetical protein